MGDNLCRALLQGLRSGAAVPLSDEEADMAELSVTFWPNPVQRTHTGEMRWYFNVGLRAEGTVPVRLARYRGEWYDMQGQLRDSKEEPLDIRLVPGRPVSYPDLWVTSAISRFRYRLIVHGRDETGRDVRAEAFLECL
jgi:hypothetical protein